MSLIFWDTNLFVYLLQDHPEFGGRVTDIRQRMISRGDQLYTSAFTLGEVLTGPLITGDEALAARYSSAIRPPAVQIIDFTSSVAMHYARIRADRSIHPADAIQLACAAQARVDLFLTNDRKLITKFVPGIQFIAGIDTPLF